MSSHDDLARRLDAVGRDGWEDAYAGLYVEMSADEEYALVTSERPWADWLAFRFAAGPPGVPLPEHEQALAAVLQGEEGTARDAYRVVFAPHSLPDQVPPEIALGVLMRSMACALKHGTTWFATWLAARAALAALALGRPDLTWRILDGLTAGGQRHPHLDKLTMFEPLRGHRALEFNPHVCAAIGLLWPQLELPLLPTLPVPTAPEERGALAATLDALEEVGATHVRELVLAAVNAADRALLDEHTNDPLVRELTALAMAPGADAPEVDTVPPWFTTWARAVGRSYQPHLARLAGLVLHRAGGTDVGFTAMLIFPAARAGDLLVLAAGFDDPVVRSMIEELTGAASALPPEAADALVASAWPHHIDADQAVMVLAHHIDALERLPTRPGGVVEHIVVTTRSIVADRARDIADAAPAYQSLVACVRRAVARLHDGGLLGGPDVERAALAIEIPALTAGLFDNIATPPAALAPMEDLVLALAMHRAVIGTEYEAHWRPMFAHAASEAIYELHARTLFGVRLTLLDELLSSPHRLLPLSKLYFQRANTRRVWAPDDRSETEHVLADLRLSIHHARLEGDASRCAAATASWIRIVAWLDAGGESNPSALTEANRLLDEALALTLEPRDQALLHQAHAHLLRGRHPEDALAAHERALAIVPAEEPHATEVAAELVTALVRLHRPREAAERGLAFLDAASSRTKATELGMLHLSVGEALVALGRHGEARSQLEAGLRLVRGRELQNEDLAHLQLARAGLVSGDLDLTREHLRLLNDRGDELDHLIRCDVRALEATIASEAGRIDVQRDALRDAISLAADDTLETRLRLELARVDLAAGREVPHLDELLVHALGLAGNGDLDHVVLDVITNLDVPLSATILEVAIGWSETRKRPDVVAKLHYRAGRVDVARERLRAALDTDLSSHMRLGCVHQMVAMLGFGPSDERRRWCDELERLLELHDHPPGRIDLASALFVDAGGDLPTLRRARRHAKRGLEDVSDRHALEVARSLLRRLERAIDRRDPHGNLDERPAPVVHVDDVIAFLGDPAGEAFARVRTQLMPSAAPGVDMPTVMARFALGEPTGGSEPPREVGAQLEALDSLDGQLASQATHQTRPGVLAARVALVARLARAGRRSADEVRSITAEAIDALSAVSPGTRSILFREVAVVWTGNHRARDAVRDATLAIDLLTRCVELEGGEAKATDHTLALLAEARRGGAGGRRGGLREARRLQELRVSRLRNADDGDALAGALCDLAEVEIDLGADGPQRGERNVRAAAAAARAPRLQARIAAALASVQTRTACALHGSEHLGALQAAMAAWNALDLTLLDEHCRHAADLHRTCCDAALASLCGDRDGAIDRWRRYLRQLEATAPVDIVAAAQHQLALALLGDADGAASIEEGLGFASSAAAVRTIADSPQAHYDTAIAVGRALLAAVRNGGLAPAVTVRAAGEARLWIERAIAAARECEAADELVRAALVLTELELATATDDTVVDCVGRAWSIVAEASPQLIFDLGSREREARAALRATASFAYRRATRAVPDAAAGVAFALNGADAELVTGWLIRAQEPARRPLRARLARPPTVSARRWTDWVAALDDRDEIRITEALDAVRAAAPDFLDAPIAADSTWRWLLACPDGAAIAFVLTEFGALVVILRIDPAGQRRTHVLGLDLPPPPAGEVLDDLVRGELPGADAADALESIAGWLRRYVIAPTEAFLGRAPAALLWCPDPRFRRVAPAAIWPGRPVAITANLALPDLSTSPARRRSTLLALADPADRASDRRLDLRGLGKPAIASLAEAAAELGTVRLLGSIGTSFGRAALGDRRDVRDTPASADNLLAEAGEHDVIVVLAHGRVDADAALLCVNEHGALDPLDVTALARTPDRFAGAAVLLLSCETGRTGDSLAEPGGVAGTLISAGARYVVAPLWTVRIDVAVQVGIAVLRGTARGAAPWEVLANLSMVAADDTPALGGPPLPPLARQAQARLQKLAFVTWVG